MNSTKIFIIVMVCANILLGAFGLISRMSYTDITRQEDYLNKLDVAEITGSFAENGCNDLKKNLPACSYIFRAEVVSGLEPEYHICKQKVRIKKVYAGMGSLENGEEIYILSQHWSFYFDQYESCIERGFVNVLKEGKDYLVFCDEHVDVQKDAPVYRLFEDSYIAPVFCYDTIDNVIAPVSGNSTYVPYESVKDNEFFPADAEANNAWFDLKDYLFKMYSL